MRQRILAGIILGLMAATSMAASISGQGTWETTLQGRSPLTPGGTDYQAYYDTALNITWLANANLAATDTFGVSGIDPSGEMFWDRAQAWIEAMNAAAYLGTNSWRLPQTIDTGNPGCDFAYAGTDCGWNVDISTSEMAHMFFSTLGNISYVSTDPTYPFTLCSDTPPMCLTNGGPFSNIQGHEPYRSGTENASDSSRAWGFNFYVGGQGPGIKAHNGYAWAVRDGDIAAVPLPAVGWLLGPALGVLGWARRKSFS